MKVGVCGAGLRICDRHPCLLMWKVGMMCHNAPEAGISGHVSMIFYTNSIDINYHFLPVITISCYLLHLYKPLAYGIFTMYQAWRLLPNIFEIRPDNVLVPYDGFRSYSPYIASRNRP
jgi:hypothetical protein